MMGHLNKKRIAIEPQLKKKNYKNNRKNEEKEKILKRKKNVKNKYVNKNKRDHPIEILGTV